MTAVRLDVNKWNSNQISLNIQRLPPTFGTQLNGRTGANVLRRQGMWYIKDNRDALNRKWIYNHIFSDCTHNRNKISSANSTFDIYYYYAYAYITVRLLHGELKKKSKPKSDMVIMQTHRLNSQQNYYKAFTIQSIWSPDTLPLCRRIPLWRNS